MSSIVAQNPGSEAEFSAIELAVMETERGRWFLREYAMRNRHADTQILLSALSRIEHSVSFRDDGANVGKFRLDIIEMSNAISRTRSEISAMKPADSTDGHLLEASDELESIVGTTERVTSDILAAAEQVQEGAWTLREANVDARICDMLDERATEIYMACSFQDLTAQRIRKVIDTLGFLERRVNAMIDIWKFHGDEETSLHQVGETAPRPSPGPSMSQEDVDSVLVENRFNAAAGQLEMAHAAGQPELSMFQREDDLDYSDVVALDPSVTQEAEAVAEPASGTGADEEIDEILFSPPAIKELPERSVAPDHLQLVPTTTIVNEAMGKVTNGVDLSADEAARALDALKQMSIEDRTRLFS